VRINLNKQMRMLTSIRTIPLSLFKVEEVCRRSMTDSSCSSFRFLLSLRFISQSKINTRDCYSPCCVFLLRRRRLRLIDGTHTHLLEIDFNVLKLLRTNVSQWHHYWRFSRGEEEEEEEGKKNLGRKAHGNM
jgi:hypothetical protein